MRLNVFEQQKENILEHWEQIIQTMTDVSKDKKGYICPLCGHGTNGDGLIRNKKSETGHGLICFGCGFSGNIIDLYMKYNNVEFIEAVKELNSILGVKNDEISNIHYSDEKADKKEKVAKIDNMDEIQAKDNTEYYLKCKDNLKNDMTARVYLTSRGISLETALKCWVGFDPNADPAQSGYTAKRIILPTSKTHYVARSIDPNTPPKYSKLNNKGGTPSIFNEKALYESTEPIFITEGIFDALSIIEVGGQAVATCSAGNYHKIIDVLNEQRTESVLILAFDNDKAGQDRQNDLIEELNKIGARFMIADICNGEKDPNEALKKNRQQFKALVKEAIEQAKDPNLLKIIEVNEKENYLKQRSAGHFLKDFIDGIKDSVNTPCIPTGFKKLDEQLDGGLYEGLYIIGAVSSLGKTTMILQILDQIAKSGQDVLIFSLEMAKAELMAKSISRQSFILASKDGCNQLARTTRDITDYKRYENYTNTVKLLIKESIEEYKRFSDHVFIVEGTGNISTNNIRKIIEDHITFTGNKPVVLIDYIQIVEPIGKYTTDKKAMDDTVKSLKWISRDFKIPVIGISSFNRMNYKEEANMTAFKESGAVEYSADVLIGLQYKDISSKEFNLYEAMKKRPREIELRILKQRNGSAGSKIPFDFYPAFNYFEEANENESQATQQLKRR